jgi:hypothetical protein
MKKQRIKAKVADLVLNEGQLGWLPTNPRQWTQKDIDLTKASLQNDPDFTEERPVLVVECDGKLLVFAGNLRTTAARASKWEYISAVLYTPENDEDKDTIKRRSILDNGAFGSWDYDMLANEWDDLPLTDWGVPAWNTEDVEIESVSAPKEHADLSGGVEPIFQITIDCENEAMQEMYYNELKDKYPCRVLTL